MGKKSDAALISYNKVLKTLTTPKADRDACLDVGIHLKYYMQIRRHLTLAKLTKIDYSSLDSKIGRPVNYHIALVDSITEIPLREKPKQKSESKGEMSKIVDLKNKLLLQSRLIHQTRQYAMHKQGAISSGGVEFV